MMRVFLIAVALLPCVLSLPGGPGPGPEPAACYNKCDVTKNCGDPVGQTCSDLVKNYNCSEYYCPTCKYAGWCDKACGYNVCDPAVIPQQVHIGLGPKPSVMMVQWATQENTWGREPSAYVQWGLTPDYTEWKQSKGSSYAFKIDPGRTWYNHVAQMTNLAPATEYYYRVGAKSTAWSKVFRFKSQVTK